MSEEHEANGRIILKPTFCIRIYFRNGNITEFHADPGKLNYPYILIAANSLVIGRALISLSSVNYFTYMGEELYNQEQEQRERER